MEVPLLENAPGLLLLIFWILWTVWAVFCIIQFFRTRTKSFYIRARSPWLIFTSAVGSYMMMTSLTFKTVIGISLEKNKGFPNMLEHWFIWLMIPLHFIPYPVRALRFIILYHVTLPENQNKDESPKVWFWFYQHTQLTNDRAALILTGIIDLIVFAVGLYRNIAVEENFPENPAPKFASTIYYTNCLVLTIAASAFLWVAVYFLKQIGDELKYTVELILIGIFWLICVGFYVICGFAHVEPYWVGSISIVILCVTTFTVSFLMPLQMALAKPMGENFGVKELENLENLLEGPEEGCAEFLKFLQKRMCPEGFFFYRDVQKFRELSTDNPDAMRAEYIRIRTKYIGNAAPLQVNIPDHMVRAIVAREANVSPDVFNEAFEENKKVLKTDCFPSFRTSVAAKAYAKRLRIARLGIAADA